MLDTQVTKEIIKDILQSNNYTLSGIAYYTNIPEEILDEILCGKNGNPSIQTLRKLLELHHTLYPNFYSEISKNYCLTGTRHQKTLYPETGHSAQQPTSIPETPNFCLFQEWKFRQSFSRLPEQLQRLHFHNEHFHSNGDAMPAHPLGPEKYPEYAESSQKALFVAEFYFLYMAKIIRQFPVA